MKAVIKAIAYYLPEGVLTNEELARDFPEWTADRIEKKLGITTRHIAGENENSADLGVAAAAKLFQSGACRPDDVDYLLFCTQSPEYFLPTTACIMQERLKIPQTAGALDFNLGCSAYVYGLGLAQGLIESGQARNVLLVTAETYSKFMHPSDKSVRTLFGDAGAATLIGAKADEQQPGGIGPFAYGTDGAGAGCLIVRAGGMREPAGAGRMTGKQPFPDEYLYMDGGAVFNFTLRVVPPSMQEVLDKAGLSMERVDLFVFHQANKFMLDHLQAKCKIPDDKFYVYVKDVGNTVSCTIPIALKHAAMDGRLSPGSKVLISGFGVGLSWASGMIEWAS